MSVTPIAGRALERHEHHFLTLVARHLRDVPRATRDDALRAATDHLVDRPPTADEDALWAAVGTPTEYATELRRTHNLGAERTDWWARWIATPRVRRWIGVTTALLLVTATVAGVSTYRWWVNWDATIHNSAFGATWLDASDPVDGITRVQARDAIEVTVPIRSGEVVQIGALLYSDDAITVDEIAIETAPSLPFEFVGVETRNPASTIWEPFIPFRLGPGNGMSDPGRAIRILIRFTDCAHFGPQSGAVLDRFELKYEGNGRDRVAVIPMRGAVTLQC